jgi:hypothetical protein
MKRIFAAIAALSVAAVALPAAAQDWRGQQHGSNQGGYGHAQGGRGGSAGYGQQGHGYDQSVGRGDFDGRRPVAERDWRPAQWPHRAFDGYGRGVGYGDRGWRSGR